MDIFEAIYSRRTIKQFKSDPVPDAVLERALKAGIWAQNHRMTQPWRFTILGPETRAALASIAASLQPSGPGADAARDKILSKPLIVAVSFRLSGDKPQQIEDYAATCCAIQNIQLAAWAEGLGMQWSSGKLIHDPKTCGLLKINSAEEEIAGLLYFGYPAGVPDPVPRKPLAEVSRRLP